MPRSDQRSAEAEAYRALYKTKRWQQLRQGVLVRDGYQCQRPGCGVLLSGRHPAPNSPSVNHIKPHRGDRALFFDPNNAEAVCKACHDGNVQSTERLGYSKAVGNDGFPIDKRHPANRA